MPFELLEAMRLVFDKLMSSLFPVQCRRRTISVSSRTSSDDSLDLPRRRKKSGRRKLDEVERLAEMEKQRRQKEAEQKVNLTNRTFITHINWSAN